jgi:thioester reductase-like protein
MDYPETLAEEVYQLTLQSPGECVFETLGGAAVTLEQLWSLASSHATALDSIDEQVAISLPRGVEWLSALLGCWILGKAPVILDPEWPDLRKEEIKKEAEVCHTISMPLVPATELAKPTSIAPDTPAYIIYSSGSSGRPKGIIVPHAGLVPMLKQQIEAFQIDSTTRSLWLHGIAFDASLSDIGTSLLARSTLCLAPHSILSSPATFYSEIEKHGITHIDIPPSLLAILDPSEAPDCLCSLVIGGSVCPKAVVRAWAQRVRLVSVYGPTEATVCTSMMESSAHWQEAVIGPPISGITYEIVDSNSEPAVEGELLISGDGVALGYLGQPQLTRERFFQSSQTRGFRSGDRVKITETGEFVFLGRIDRQIKKQGKLISPEEIESALQSQPSISEVFVALKDSHLTAWIEASSKIDPRDLITALLKILPDWMIPSQWNFVAKMPRLSNGKLDQVKLANISSSQSSSDLDDSRMGHLTKIAREILKSQDFSADDDFFLSGGDSLAAMRFLSAAEESGIPLKPDCFYRHGTIRKISAAFTDTESYATSSERLLQRAGSYRTSPAISDKSHGNDLIFLTGATGFLGSAILGEILTRTDTPVTCLIRGERSQKEKLIRQKLKDHGFDHLRSFDLVEGNLETRNLGLPDETWRTLYTQCSQIIHSAASTHSLAPYDLLEPANVHGTASILRLKNEGRQKRLIYASTLSVFVDASPLPPVCLESDLLESPTTIYGGYAQTKWVSEKMVQASAEGATIIRFGLLTANQQTGLVSQDDILTRILTGRDHLPRLEDLPKDASFDFTPVDYAASVVVDILLQEPVPFVFHVANPQQVPAARLYKALELSDFKINFSAESQPLSLTDHPRHLFKTGGTSFSTLNTKAVETTPCPETSQDDLIKIFNLIKLHLTS